MKSTGIVRKVDELGRVVLPKELRTTLDINIKDPLEIYIDGENIILKKYAPACIFCGNTDGIENHMGKNICAECRAKILHSTMQSVMQNAMQPVGSGSES